LEWSSHKIPPPQRRNKTTGGERIKPVLFKRRNVTRKMTTKKEKERERERES